MKCVKIGVLMSKDSRIRATAALPAHAAHYVQVGNLRAYMQRIGHTAQGSIVLEAFSGECAYTIFHCGTIYIYNELHPISGDAYSEVSAEELQALLDQSTDWQLRLPCY